MMKLNCNGSVSKRLNRITGKVLLVQLMLSLCFFSGIASGMSQNQEINLTFENATLSQILKRIGEMADCKFVFNYDDLNRYQVSATLENKSVEESLKILLQDKPFRFERQGEFFVISYKENDQHESGFTVRGRVLTESGMPLPGVTIIIKGTTIGTATKADGTFELRVKEKNTQLVFSFVGMKTKEVMTNGNEPLQVELTEEAEMLSEVVATGYQTISQERSTGSATIVNSRKLDQVQATGLASKLEGVTPGLLNYGGSMAIRGTSSFAVGSTPLLVVDGQVMNVTLGTLNPNDIESVTVLKDAAATSLYGVRASNGVIVVTTKKAKSDKTDIQVSAGFYIDPLPDMGYLDYASTSDIIDFEQEFIQNDPTYQQNPADYFSLKNDPANPKYLTGIERLYYELSLGNLTQNEVNEQIDAMRKNDYRKETRKALQHTAITQDYNLSVSKGKEHSNLFLSLRYQDQGQYEKSADSKRFSVYLKNEMDVTDWFTLGYGANAYFSRSEYSNGNAHFTNAMPYERLKDNDGNPVYQYYHNYYLSQNINETEGLKFMGYNALEASRQNRVTTKDWYLKFFAHTDFKLLEGLNLGLKFQYERNNTDQNQYDEADSYKMRRLINQFASVNSYGNFVYHIPEGGHIQETYNRNEFYNFRAQLNYQKNIAEKHDLSVLLGGEIRQDQWKGTGSEKYGYDKDKLTHSQVDWLTLSQNGVTGQLSTSTVYKLSEYLQSSDTKHRYVSAYANAGYTYDGRYTLNGSIRVDQADLFGTDPKYRYRPLWSMGAAWNITNETFMRDKQALDLLKLRVTYGITGNVDQTSSPYLIGSYLTSPYTNSNITDIMTPPNKMLRWEKTSSLNVGIDFSLFARLNGSLDVYRRYSTDLLANKTLDPSLGFSSAKVNNGEMKNIGVELSIGYDWLKKNKDWSLTTQFTAAYNKNKIEKIGFTPSNAIDMLQYPYSNYLKGDTYGSIYAYRYAGLTENGDPSVYDENGEIQSGTSVRDIRALVVKGQLTPKWNGALTINLKWKTLELFTKFVYYAGHALRNDVTPLYSMYASDMMNPSYGTISGNMHKDIVKRWTPENPDTDVPAMGVYGLQQDRELQWRYADTHVLSASFIKCRNIGLSYTLPQKWLASLKLNDISLRAQVNNPFYWAKNKEGIDPEAFNANAGTRTQAQVTTYVFGLNIHF